MALVNLIDNPNVPATDFVNSAWTAVQGCAVRRSTKKSQTGTASLLITGSSSTAVARSNSVTDDYIPSVFGNSEYRAVARFSHDSIGREIKIGIIFYDVASAVIATTTTFSCSASQTLSAVTVTTSGAHGLETGQMVTLSGFSSQPALNLQERVITVTGATTFTVVASDSATRSDTGGTATLLECQVASAQMGYDDWTLASVVATSPANAVYAAAQIVFEDIDTGSTFDQFLYIDNPSLVSTEVPSSAWADGVFESVPEYMKIADEAQTSPTYPLARYVDLVASRGQEILDIYEDIEYISPVDGGPVGGTSALVDPAAYPDGGMKKEWLKWLAQLLATRSVSVPGGSTSWAALSAAYSTWDGWEDSLNPAAAPAAVSISSRSRTSGISTITTSAAHGLSVGDSVVISGAGSYNGVHLVSEVLSSTQFTFSQVMPLLSISRSGTTVTATVGTAHNYSTSDSVVVSGTGTVMDGTFSVVSTSTTDDLPNVFTYTTGTSGALGPLYLTGSTYPANNSSGAAGTTQIGSDLSWLSIEQYAPYPVDPDFALTYLLRTGAAGVWAGTIEGLKRAARLALTGWDSKASFDCSSGTMTITTVDQHSLTAADEGVTTVEVYAAANDKINRTYTVDTVISDTQFTVACGPKTESFVGWVTNKIVQVSRGYWSGVPSSISTSGGAMTVTFNSPIPFATTSAPVVITGTGNVSVDTTHNPASVTIASNRLSISFASAVSLGSPLTPSDARVRLVGGLFTFVVKTLNTQTDGAGTVLAFADQAKAAGAAISHEYI